MASSAPNKPKVVADLVQRHNNDLATAEGVIAGSTLLAAKRRMQEQKEEEALKKSRLSHHSEKDPMKLEHLSSKFTASSFVRQEQDFKSKMVGLITIDEFRKVQEEQKKLVKNDSSKDKGHNNNEHINDNDHTDQEKVKREKEEKKLRKQRKKDKKKQMATLSFAGDEEDDEDDAVDNSGAATTVKASKKDPTVDTSFLPDKYRESVEEQKRQQLEKEWQEQQEEVRNQKLEITYSYWDGTGHRRSVEMLKKNTIGDFLEAVRKSLCQEFRELTSVSADALLYVKEDLIIPQDLTFYDLIVTKARGKSGPLFHFDVHDDVRVGTIDVRIEKDESHPGKVVERRWYERNKHIFPASRWELYDPAKDYGKYTIKGGGK